MYYGIDVCPDTDKHMAGRPEQRSAELTANYVYTFSQQWFREWDFVSSGFHQYLKSLCKCLLRLYVYSISISSIHTRRKRPLPVYRPQTHCVKKRIMWAACLRRISGMDIWQQDTVIKYFAWSSIHRQNKPHIQMKTLVSTALWDVGLASTTKPTVWAKRVWATGG